MRARSKKRQREEREYAKLRLAYLDANPLCQSPWACGQRATEIHHMAGRSGHRLVDASRFKALCQSCHRRVTEWPAEAYALGLSLRRVGEAS